MLFKNRFHIHTLYLVSFFQHFYIIFTPYFERKLYITKSLQTLFNKKYKRLLSRWLLIA